ncbi:MAG: MMPL family transporter, partial [Nannocystaceae bacterium]|nr:MMPL family transporter [Nannocystaceae bacterium]
NSRGIYAAYGSMTTSEGDVELAADFFVIPEIFDAIDADGPRVMAVSVAVMLLTALVLLRNVWGALGVAVTVGFSLMWLAAVFLGLDWKLNFFNIIVLPLLLGMGQDDALHLVERHREEVERTGKSNMGRVLREAGGAIFVTTLTTVLGFSGILFANHRGLESMAWAAVLGMTLALVASVVVLPILLHLGLKFASSRGSRSRSGDSGRSDA